jgi:Vacuolar protein sorting-associated protein 62
MRLEYLCRSVVICALIALPSGDTLAVRAEHATRKPSLARRLLPLASGDADRDGLADAWESTLAARYAPIVLLAPSDRYRPASIEWILSRFPSVSGSRRKQLSASLGGKTTAFSAEVRKGSGDPRDWVTYVHVYPRTDGGINVQYWFFYPFNDGMVLFDHEGDWEHVTVETDAKGRPRALLLAQHGNNRPGVPRSWADVRKDGDHPIVWSARGTHASYSDARSSPWFERVSGCITPIDCRGPIWRTWEGGGLANIGERDALLGQGDAFAYDGRWGGSGHWFGPRAAPRGPVQQPQSFQNGGFD